MADLETTSPEAAYATKANIVYPDEDAGGHSAAGAGRAGQADISDRLGQETAGQDAPLAGGRVLSPGQHTTVETAEAFTLLSGAVGQDETQIVVLPEGVQGTYVISNIVHTGGTSATTALDLDANTAAVQAAIDVATGAANEIIAVKAANRRVVGLVWSSAGEDETDRAQVVVTVSATAEAGVTLPQES